MLQVESRWWLGYSGALLFSSKILVSGTLQTNQWHIKCIGGVDNIVSTVSIWKVLTFLYAYRLDDIG